MVLASGVILGLEYRSVVKLLMALASTVILGFECPLLDMYVFEEWGLSDGERRFPV